MLLRLLGDTHTFIRQCIRKMILYMEKILTMSEFVKASRVNGKVSSCQLLLNKDLKNLPLKWHRSDIYH